MGWIAINLVLPVLAPLLLVFLAGSVCTPHGKLRSRLRVIRAVKDGQLGWLAVVFSANAIFELNRVVNPPGWTGLVLACCVALLTVSSMSSVFGALFPVPELGMQHSLRSRIFHYRLLSASVFFVLIGAILLCIVHFVLEPACK